MSALRKTGDDVGEDGGFCVEDQVGPQHTAKGLNPMDQISGYSRVLARVRVKQVVNKPLLGKPHLKYGQCHALWGYFFQLGGILGAKYARHLDAFGNAFLSARGKPGAVKDFFTADADRILAEFPIDSMTFADYVGAEFIGRVDYTEDAATYLVQHGKDKISPDTAEELAWQYSQHAAALGATHPDTIRDMFARTHVIVPKDRWQDARSAGLDIPEQQDLMSYDETEEGEDQAFMEYCRTCCPTLHTILRS